ncbi:actin-binding Rho-activating protein-like [Ctenocephalides felis]|uniref:actin-binding Rho-activating protein-like n=1 Tax=Ctenocephalides felis TaxID=7515 RepID=UPI000E6E45FC|nr:actin-binding Rho-activating protein-like [Ctenocephalides felis]
MSDVDHEVGAIRFIVDSPLSDKVAKFNKVVNKHLEAQALNPFSQTDGRKSPRPVFSKEEYGRPAAGSLSEARSAKASLHICREMLELCTIINDNGIALGENHPHAPGGSVILFGELFNIYTYISDKLVGMLLRARKHKLIDFEGEVLFQRRDDEVPIFLLKPMNEIKEIFKDKESDIRRSISPNPQTIES